MKDIKKICTYTLTDADEDCKTYNDTVDFLTNKLFDEDRQGRFHYKTNPKIVNGKTLVLFKYKGKLIGKGIFSERVDVEEICNGELYSGFYQAEKGSIEIFSRQIDLETINNYFPVKDLKRDRNFDRRYRKKIFEMIEEFTD